MYAQQHEGSDGLQSAGDVRSDGWPAAGLEQALHDMVRRGLGDGPAFFMPTPSTITSESSSDLDTESAGSFFPEKSTTLGSLIGLQSSSHSDQSQAALVPGHGESVERRKNTVTSSSSVRNRTGWCPMFGCGMGSSREALGMSPSLAHLLEEERKAAGAQRQASNGNNAGEQFTEFEKQGCGTPSVLAQTNTLFDAERILPPHPSGAPLRLILQHPSPSSSYVSVDWNVFNGRPLHHQRGGGGEGPSHAKLFTFWPNLCSRVLGSRLTT